MSNNYISTVSRARWMILLTGGLFTLFGLVSLVSTWTALEAAAIYIGVVSIVAGVIAIFYAIYNISFAGWAWAMIEGVVDILFGILVLNFLSTAARMLPFIIGVWVLLRGVLYMIDAFGVSMRYAARSAMSRLGIGVVLAILGFYLIVDWELQMAVLSIIVSISFVCIGLWNFVVGLDMYAKPKNGIRN